MNVKDFCKVFCSGMSLKEVPIGYAIRTPFKKADGDYIGMYLRRMDSQIDLYRVEDDGLTVASLEECGVDIDNEARQQEMQKLLDEYGCQYSDVDFVIHTDFVNESDIPALFLKFTALLLRLQDLAFLTSEKVRNTFLKDLEALVERNFSSKAKIDFGVPIQSNFKDYIADIVIRPENGKVLAIYAGTSEVKALEALLFEERAKRETGISVKSMLVLETSKPGQIKTRTLSRVINSDVLLTAMDGEEWEITKKMAESLSIPAPSIAVH